MGVNPPVPAPAPAPVPAPAPAPAPPIEYPSAELLLSIVQKEYDSEDERSKMLDTRVNILLPLSVALLAFIASFLKVSQFKDQKTTNVWDALPYAIFIVLAISAIIVLLFAIIWLIRVLATRKYNRMDLDDIEDHMCLYEKDKTAVGLLRRYKENTKVNIAENNKKVKLYEQGIYLISISIVLSVLMYIFNINL